jgi:predicted kinase
MTVKIVMGTAFSGKSYFIKENFPDCEILSVGEYQKKIKMAEKINEHISLQDYKKILQMANDQIKRDMVERLSQGKNVIMEHTLYKGMRRKEYLEAFWSVTTDPIDIYVMQPSDERLLKNIQTDEKQSEKGIDWIKSQMRDIEIPSILEGFSHVYLVSDEGVRDWSDAPLVTKTLDRTTKMNFIEKNLNDTDKSKDNNIFGKKPFKYICECCLKVEILTSKEAYEQGWDYPGEGAVYPSSMFGGLSPRTCGKCSIAETAYWAIVVEKKTTAELSEKQLQAVERIMKEPDILRVIKH